MNNKKPSSAVEKECEIILSQLKKKGICLDDMMIFPGFTCKYGQASVRIGCTLGDLEMRTIDFAFDPESNLYNCRVFLIDPIGFLAFNDIPKNKLHLMFDKDYGGYELEFFIDHAETKDGESLFAMFEKQGYKRMPWLQTGFSDSILDRKTVPVAENAHKILTRLYHKGIDLEKMRVLPGFISDKQKHTLRIIKRVENSQIAIDFTFNSETGRYNCEFYPFDSEIKKAHFIGVPLRYLHDLLEENPMGHYLVFFTEHNGHESLNPNWVNRMAQRIPKQKNNAQFEREDDLPF